MISSETPKPATPWTTIRHGTHTYTHTQIQVTAAYRLRAWVRWGARYSMKITDDDDDDALLLAKQGRQGEG